MTNYTRPGVYVEESLNPLSEIVNDPAESAAAFVGVVSAGGPVGPILITSWSQYQALYGGIANLNDDLAYAVYSFFANGGPGCYIVRALNTNATSASLSINGTQATPAPVLTVTANAPGIWASDPASVSRVFVTVQPTTATGVNRFDLIIEVGSGTLLAAREQFVDLTMDRNDPRYAPDVVNSPVVGSKYVSLANQIALGTAFAATLNPASTTKAPLTAGTDGTGTPDLVAATQRLDSVDRNLVVNVPGANATDTTSIVNWAVTSGRHFVVADVPKPASGETAAASVTAITAYADALPNVSQVAVYGPWIYLADPGSKAGAMRLTAPGGAVVGQYLRTDASRGVHKAPAGTQTVIAGAVSPYTTYTNAQMDTLASSQVNLIKTVPGSGVVIWGARTQGFGFPDRYVPVRRLLIALKSGLTSVTRFATFENNNEDLWSTTENVVDTYLQGLYDLGSFKGDSPDQAFYVICDATNNDQQDMDSGTLNVEVGVALANPAEFIVIRLGQTQAGTTATDSLEEE